MHSRIAALALGIVSLAGPVRGASPEANLRTFVPQTPPAAAVNSVAVSPDGSLVASAAGEGGIRLHDARTGTLLRTLGASGDRGVVFAPDGRTLTAAGFHMDKLLDVFDARTGKRVLALPGHTEWEVDAVAISPDGKLLASTGTDKQLLVWELPTGKLRLRLKQQAFRNAALVFSPDSATLATGGGDKLVRLWDAATGELRRSFAGHTDWVAALAFAPDGRSVVSASCDWGFHRGHDWVRPSAVIPERSEWRQWDIDSGKLLRTVTETGRMLSVAFAPDGRSLACGVQTEVRLYDLATDTASRVITAHDAIVTSVAFTPDGAAIVSGSHDQTVKRAAAATGDLEWIAPGNYEQVNSVALSDDGSLLVTGSSDHRFARNWPPVDAGRLGPGAVRLWDARTGRLLRRLGEHSIQFVAVAVSDDGRRIAGGGGGRGGTVSVWDAETGSLLWSMNEFAEEVLAVAFTPDGRWLAAGSADGMVKICDAQSGAVSLSLTGHEGGATSLAFSPGSDVLTCGPGRGGALIWDASSGRVLRTCAVAAPGTESLITDRFVNSIGLSRDGKTLATCLSSVNNEIVDPVRLWDPRTGALKREFAAEGIHGRPMALSPDGSILATGGKSVKIWDVAGGKMLRELFGHLKRTQSIIFSADGRLVLSGGSYGTTNIWETATGRHLVTLFAFAGSQNGEATDDWLACRPAGYYSGSPGVERYLAWRVGDDLQSAEFLGSQLNRPDRVEAALKY